MNYIAWGCQGPSWGSHCQHHDQACHRLSSKALPINLRNYVQAMKQPHFNTTGHVMPLYSSSIKRVTREYEPTVHYLSGRRKDHRSQLLNSKLSWVVSTNVQFLLQKQLQKNHQRIVWTGNYLCWNHVWLGTLRWLSAKSLMMRFKVLPPLPCMCPWLLRPKSLVLLSR